MPPVLTTLVAAVRRALAPPRPRRGATPPEGRPRPGPAPAERPTGQHAGRVVTYAPNLDGDADPGEVVWTWVPFEEDRHRGKDRPVLVVGRDGAAVHALMLSSQHDRDGQPDWYALGPGAWDRKDRPSWVRLDRVLTVDHGTIRREGAILDRRRFDAVAAQLRARYGWS